MVSCGHVGALEAENIRARGRMGQIIQFGKVMAMRDRKLCAQRREHARRGFSLIECGALVLVLSMVGMTVGPSIQSVRTSMRGAASTANLQSVGFGAAMYAGSNQGRLFGYSWRADESYIMPDGLEISPSTSIGAAQAQNTEILQRWTGRFKGPYKMITAPSRLPHKRFSHLVLRDFIGYSATDTRFIDPADADQFVWHSNPLDYRIGSTVPYANGIPGGYDDDARWANGAVKQRWAFASSYQVVPSAWQSDGPNRYLPVATTPNLFTGGPFVDLASGRNITEVSYPSQKVWMHEEFDRDGKAPLYFGYDQARAEKLMFDGSVNSWASGDANVAVVPEYGFSAWTQRYVPLDTFPVPMGGLGDAAEVHQRYRWTYRGLKGVDYGNAVPKRGPRVRNR